jgi:hypothetical protein
MSEKLNITSQTVIARAEGLVASDLDGETVLLNLASGKYFGMDLIGSRIWELLEKPLTMTKLCDALIEEYDVAREQCEHDVANYLSTLLEKKLIDLSDEPVE